MGGPFREGRQMNANLLIIFGIMALFVTIVGLVDIIGQRQERKQSRR
jgi:hypothetical protein